MECRPPPGLEWSDHLGPAWELTHQAFTGSMPYQKAAPPSQWRQGLPPSHLWPPFKELIITTIQFTMHANDVCKWWCVQMMISRVSQNLSIVLVQVYPCPVVICTLSLLYSTPYDPESDHELDDDFYQVTGIYSFSYQKKNINLSICVFLMVILYNNLLICRFVAALLLQLHVTLIFAMKLEAHEKRSTRHYCLVQ